MTPEEKWPLASDMGQISGFGGSYEEACQKMLRAGLQWLEENPEADPWMTNNPYIYGIICEENQAAKDLSAVIIATIPDCSGAMHHATMSHCLFVKKNGWGKYVEHMRRHGGQALYGSDDVPR